MHLSYFEFNEMYQGKNIIHAASGRRLIKAAIYNAFRSREYLLYLLAENPEFVVQEKTEQELNEWDKAILSTKGLAGQYEECNR
ncbi:MAG TPA: hypothetical protein VGC65_00240 [Bacteroidia bacterium]|jgi:hypothetical protein